MRIVFNYNFKPVSGTNVLNDGWQTLQWTQQCRQSWKHCSYAIVISVTFYVVPNFKTRCSIWRHSCCFKYAFDHLILIPKSLLRWKELVMLSSFLRIKEGQSKKEGQLKLVYGLLTALSLFNPSHLTFCVPLIFSSWCFRAPSFILLTGYISAAVLETARRPRIFFVIIKI